MKNMTVDAQAVLDYQKSGYDRLTDLKKVNSPASVIKEIEEKIQPVALECIQLPKIYYIRVKSELELDTDALEHGRLYTTFGEIAQEPHLIAIFDPFESEFCGVHDKSLFELVPIHEIADVC